MASCERRGSKVLLSSRGIASKVPGACPSEAQAPPPDDAPPEDETVEVRPRRHYSALRHWVDDIHNKLMMSSLRNVLLLRRGGRDGPLAPISLCGHPPPLSADSAHGSWLLSHYPRYVSSRNLLHILANATDLARSPNGWVFLHSLKRYSGRAVSGNVDAHSDTTLHENTFFLTNSGQPSLSTATFSVPLRPSMTTDAVAASHQVKPPTVMVKRPLSSQPPRISLRRPRRP